MKKNLFIQTALAVSISTFMLTGCSGGGGGVSAPAQTTTPPTNGSGSGGSGSGGSGSGGSSGNTVITPTPTAPVKVGVIDSGALKNSTFLTGNVSKVINYSVNGQGQIVATDISNSTDDSVLDTSTDKHGTFVSEIIAANSVNGSTAGAANGIANIYAAQTTIDAQGSSYDSVNFAAMLDLQAQFGVNLFNLSSGAYTGTVSNTTVDYASQVVANGGLVVLSAGNNGNSQPTIESLMPVANPSLEKGWLVVAGLNQAHTGLYKATGSEGSSDACGDAAKWCLSADYVNQNLGLNTNGTTAAYDFYGTSGSAPQVTAEAALVWSQFGWMTADQVRQTILTTANYIDDGSGSIYYNSTYGWGYYNTEAALKGPALFSTIFGSDFEANLPSGATSYFNNNISGDAGLIKAGLGELVLNGTDTYTGSTTINAGALQVNGSITSATTVNQDGTLSGSGTVSSVTNNGTVSTKDGALKVGGDYTQSSTGSLIYSVGNTLSVSGAANLAGALQVYAKDSSVITKGDSTVLNASGGVNGTFNTTASVSSFLTLNSVTYNTNNVIANIDYANAATAGTTSGGISVASGALINALMDKANDQALAGQTTNLTNYVAGLQTVNSSTQAQSILNSDSGALFAESPSVLLHNASLVNGQAVQRAYNVSSTGKGGVWANTGYSATKLDAKNWNSVNSDIYTSSVGFDGVVGDGQGLLGAFLSNYKDNTKYNGLDGKSEVTMYSMGLYGKWDFANNFYVMGSAHYGTGNNKFDRTITTGVSTSQSNVKVDVENAGAYLEVGNKLSVSDKSAVTPYLGLSHDYAKTDAVKESDANGVAVSASKAQETQAHVGVRFEYQPVQNLSVNAYAEYDRAIDRSLPTVNLSSNVDNTVSVSYKAPSFTKDSVVYGVGAAYTTLGQNWTFFGNVNGVTDDATNFQAQLGLKYNF